MKMKNLIPFCYEANFSEHYSSKRSMKLIGHTLYSYGVILGLAFYGMTAFSTNEFNPFKLLTAVHERNERIRLNNEIFDENLDRLFGKNGYADTNKDGVVSILETISVLDKIRDPNFKFVECDVIKDKISCDFKFSLSLKNLEEAIKSYEGRK